MVCFVPTGEQALQNQVTLGVSLQPNLIRYLITKGSFNGD